MWSQVRWEQLALIQGGGKLLKGILGLRVPRALVMSMFWGMAVVSFPFFFF
jgi:hypothetical protein